MLEKSCFVRMALVAVVLGIVVDFGAAEAKCPFAVVQVAGRIVDETTKKPVEGAEIAGFVDGEGIHFSRNNRADTAILKTSDDGTYGGEFYFNRYSGLRFFIFPDACNKVPDKVELVVLKEGYLPMKRKLRAKEPPAIKDQWPQYDFVVPVPEIALVPMKPNSPDPAAGMAKKR